MGWSYGAPPQLLERHERLMGTRSVLEAGGAVIFSAGGLKLRTSTAPPSFPRKSSPGAPSSPGPAPIPRWSWRRSPSWGGALRGSPQLLERHERLMGTRSVLEAGGGRDLLSRWSQAENIDGPTLIPP